LVQSKAKKEMESVMAEKERTEDEKTELEEAFKQQQSEMQERVPGLGFRV
jgi:hypothetical protein